MVGVELGADGELAGGVEVEEGDPGEVHEGRLPRAQGAVQILPQFTQGEEVQLSPQLDHRNRAVLPHLDAVQALTFPNAGGTTSMLPLAIGLAKLRRGYGVRWDTRREPSLRRRIPRRQALLSYRSMGTRGELLSDRRTKEACL